LASRRLYAIFVRIVDLWLNLAATLIIKRTYAIAAKAWHQKKYVSVKFKVVEDTAKSDKGHASSTAN